MCVCCTESLKCRKCVYSVGQACLFNSYVTFSKKNPNSRKSFLHFMSDIAENLINTSDAVSSPSSSDESQDSSRTPTPTPTKRVPKNDPPGRLDGQLKKQKLVHIPPTNNDKTPTRKCRVCVRKKVKKETRILCVQCGVPLHPEGCYTRYHTLKHYWRYVLNFKSLSHIVFV
jgi:hypothetical protein